MTPLEKPSSRRGLSRSWKLNFSRSFDGLLSAVALSFVGSLTLASAATLTWDTSSGDGATITAGNGNWNLTGTNLVWNNGSTNVAWTHTSNTDASNAAVFAGTDGTANQYTVTLGAQMAAESVTFNSSGYRITGGTVALMPTTTTNGAVTVAAGKTATIASAIAYAQNKAATFTVNSGATLDLSGGASNSQYTFTGGGTINMTAGTYTANIGNVSTTFNQSGGTFNMTPGNAVGYNITSNSQNVDYNLSGGTLSVNGNNTTANSVNNAYLAIGNGTSAYTSTLNVQAGATMNVGTTASTSGEIQISRTASSNGTLNVSGGTLTVGTGSADNEIYLFKAGSSAGFEATMTQSGGTVTTNGIQFGGSTGATTYSATSSASLELSGGALYIGAAGITSGSDAASLPTTIRLLGGTLGANQTWSSSLDMKLGAATIQAENAASSARNITLSGALSDNSSAGTLTKTGAGTLTLSGANTYTGPTTISAGTLAMGASDVLPDASDISIGAATLDAATFTDTAGTLDVTAATSTIDLETGASIEFADSSAVDWSGGTLNITGTFASGSSLRFGTTSGGLTAEQLGSISADGSPTFSLDQNGYLVAGDIPEAIPAAVSFATAGSEFPSENQTFASGSEATITLTYSIDSAGVISLDASTNSTAGGAFANTVNAWDNPNIGSVVNSAWFNKTFTLTGSASSNGTPKRLTITKLGGGGIGIEGENSNRVDGLNYGAGGATSEPETLTWTLSAPSGLALSFHNWSYAEGDGGDIRVSNGTTNADFANMSGATGSPTLSDLLVTNGGSLTFSEIPDMGATDGASISGFGFSIVAPPVVVPDVVVSLANTGTGFGPTPPYILSGSNAATIALAFSIDGSGVISLDASTTSTNATFISTVNEWDNASIGTTSNSAWFNTSFTLTGSGSGGANLAITELGGGGIGIQGENVNRVDGLNYGTDGANSTPETLTWTLSGAPAAMNLSLKNWSYAEGNGSDIRVTAGATYSDFANMSGATGTLDLPAGLTLANGDALTFKEIPDIGAADGATIAGFSFDLIGLPGFDNGAGNGLWTNAANWSPDGQPAAPTDAVINGYDVVLNTAASASPDELFIPNGSLTLSSSGALSLRAMTIGRDLTKTVRLVMDGSGVSFGYNGSSAADEFAIGSAATVETKPDSGGCEPLELGAAKLVLDTGAEWILDGTNAGSFTYNVGDRLVLANFGSFSGTTNAIRTRNFDLPANRRLVLVSTSTSIYFEVQAQSAPSGPNIIIINTDDQAADQHFSFDGRNCITPTLQSLVDTGLKFNAAFCASSVCGSSRYAMLTSRWPSRNTSDNFKNLFPDGTLGRFGVSDTELEHDGQNIGAWLQQAGYRTGFVGKSHVLDDDLKNTSNWAAKGLITYSSSVDPALDATANAAMQHNHRIVCQNMRALGFDYVDALYHANLKELFNTKLNVHNQEWITSRALKFIEENRSERFFLYMAPTINHGPVNDQLAYTLEADPRYTSAGFLPDEDYSFMPTRASIVSQVLGAGKAKISARETWLDYSVKAIIDKLTAYGIRNDTLIIFTSDHGEKTLSSPTIWGKTSLYDLGLKVPLVMNWPNGIANPGRAYNELVSHVDIGTTLLDLAGASNLPTRTVDGVSLVSVFNGSSAAVRDDLFGEIGYARAVRTKTRKYIAVRYTPAVYATIASGGTWPEYNANSQLTGGTIDRPYYLNNSGLGAGAASTNPTYFDDDQLYNLGTDPNEDTNIYGQEPATAYDLKKRLANYIGSIPNRPFRQFSDSSAEFSPTPAAAPTAPGSGSVDMTFNNLNQVQLTWTDSANSELGYIVRKTVNGGTPVIVGEYPPGTTSATVNLDSGVEDILLQVASYNAVGDTAVNQDMLSPDPWRYRTFGGSDPTLSGPVSQWDNDADGDGVTTMWEYAAGTDPLSASSVAKPEMRMTTESSNRFLEYVLPRSSRRGVQFRGAVSTDLSTWQSGSPHCTVVEEGASQMIFRSATPVSGATRQFIRAEMIDPPNAQQP